MFATMFIGVGATALLDIWSAARSYFAGAPAPDYGLVGRWLAYLPRGQFFHAAIARSAPVSGERLIGWAAHYLIGIAFAGILLCGWGAAWAREPTLGAAMIVGIGSVAAPFLVMQPGMGAGIAAHRTADPRAARLRSLTTHTIFGFALYASGWAMRFIDV